MPGMKMEGHRPNIGPCRFRGSADDNFLNGKRSRPGWCMMKLEASVVQVGCGSIAHVNTGMDIA